MSFLHVDMDAFYAAVEQRDHPELRGKPIAVGGSKTGRGVVSTASYEARRFGVHSAMPGRRAAEFCPELIFVRGRMSHYAAIGKQLREIFHRYTPLVQPLSLDEAFLDVGGSLKLWGDAETIGRAIKHDIKKELQLTASVGIAPRKFAAKIASDYDKPDGFVVIGEDELIAFLDPLPIERLWGVGRVGHAKLLNMGIRRVGDIRRQDPDALKRRLGNWGDHLWKLAHGIDPRTVVVDHEAKQISHERTFHEDVTDPEMLRAVVSHLGEQVGMRLRRNARKCNTITLKYRREDFRTFNRSRTIETPTHCSRDLIEVAQSLLDEMRERQPRPVRLIGVSAGNLCGEDEPQQMMLFDDGGQQSEQAIDQVVDKLADRLGRDTVYRASSHRWLRQEKR